MGKFMDRHREVAANNKAFTWQSRADPNIVRYLDRCWVPTRWNHSSSEVANKIRAKNDHWPVIINLGKTSRKCRPFINPIVYSNNEFITRVNDIDILTNSTLQDKNLDFKQKVINIAEDCANNIKRNNNKNIKNIEQEGKSLMKEFALNYISADTFKTLYCEVLKKKDTLYKERAEIRKSKKLIIDATKEEKLTSDFVSKVSFNKKLEYNGTMDQARAYFENLYTTTVALGKYEFQTVPVMDT